MISRTLGGAATIVEAVAVGVLALGFGCIFALAFSTVRLGGPGFRGKAFGISIPAKGFFHFTLPI